jgi:hypothetical protein
MSFDPRRPYEIHYAEAKSGDEMVETFDNEAEMQTRAIRLSVDRLASSGSIRLFHVSRRRIASSVVAGMNNDGIGGSGIR